MNIEKYIKKIKAEKKKKEKELGKVIVSFIDKLFDRDDIKEKITEACKCNSLFSDERRERISLSERISQLEDNMKHLQYFINNRFTVTVLDVKE